MRLWPMLMMVGLLGACDDDNAAPGIPGQRIEGDQVNYGDATEVYVTPEGDFVIGGGAERPADECVQIADACVDIEPTKTKYCDDEGALVDVAVVDDEAVAAVCYPAPDGGQAVEQVVEDEDGTPTIPQNVSGAVVTFDESTDGEPIKGDLQGG